MYAVFVLGWALGLACVDFCGFQVFGFVFLGVFVHFNDGVVVLWLCFVRLDAWLSTLLWFVVLIKMCLIWCLRGLCRLFCCGLYARWV